MAHTRRSPSPGGPVINVSGKRISESVGTDASSMMPWSDVKFEDCNSTLDDPALAIVVGRRILVSGEEVKTRLNDDARLSFRSMFVVRVDDDEPHWIDATPPRACLAVGAQTFFFSDCLRQCRCVRDTSRDKNKHVGGEISNSPCGL